METYHRAAGRNIHKCQARNCSAKEKRRVGDTTRVGSLEDSRGSLIGRKTVERSACNVQVRVGGGKDKDQDAGVDDVRQDLDAGEGGCDNER